MKTAKVHQLTGLWWAVSLTYDFLCVWFILMVGGGWGVGVGCAVGG